MTTAPVLGEGPDRRRATRIAFVVTHPMTIRYLLRGQLAFLAQQGFEVSVLSGPEEGLGNLDAGRATHRPIRGLGREIRLGHDILALFRIFRVLRQIKPDIVNASTPKAGLLGMLAAFFARVPCRIYTQRGLRLESARGFKKMVLVSFERAAAACAHRVVFVSKSLRARALALDLVDGVKTEVLGAGSSNGIDTTRFHAFREPTDLDLRQALGLADDALVVGFVGRLTRDKGIEDLVAAFGQQVQPRVPSTRLLIVGDFESGDMIDQATQESLEANPAVVLAGFVADSAPYYRLMDVLAFPSYREGFPNAPLEAAATGVPVAAYAATGTVDAVVDGVTGTLVRVGDVESLGRAVSSYLLDPDLRLRHGGAGRARVKEQFRSESVWANWLNLYRSCSSTCRKDVPAVTEPDS